MARFAKFLSRRIVGVLLMIGALALAGVQPATAQSGADLAVSIAGKKAVKVGQNITYTVTATNVGDATATGVQLEGWVPYWFNFVARECLTGSPGDAAYGCAFGDVGPAASVRMTITVQACCAEATMYELGFVSATNDVNIDNNTARIKVVFAGRRA